MPKDPLTHLYSREALDAQPSAIRDICALVARPEVRSLAGGWPDPAKFPIEAIRRIFDDLMVKHGDQMLQYGSTEGLEGLRQVLAERMKTEGLTDAAPDNLIITHGSAQGMHLAAQVFIDREDVVIVGLPTYFGGPGAVTLPGRESCRCSGGSGWVESNSPESGNQTSEGGRQTCQGRLCDSQFPESYRCYPQP